MKLFNAESIVFKSILVLTFFVFTTVYSKPFVSDSSVPVTHIQSANSSSNEKPTPMPTCVYENEEYKVWVSGVGYKTGNDHFDVQIADKISKKTRHLRAFFGSLKSVEIIGPVVCLHTHMVGNFTYAGDIVYIADCSKPDFELTRMQYNPKWRSPNRKWFIFRDPCQKHGNHFSKFFFQLWTIDRKGFRIKTIKNEGKFHNFDVLNKFKWSTDSRSVTFEAAEYHAWDGNEGTSPYYSPIYKAVVRIPDEDPEHLDLKLTLKSKDKINVDWRSFSDSTQ